MAFGSTLISWLECNKLQQNLKLPITEESSVNQLSLAYCSETDLICITWPNNLYITKSKYLKEHLEEHNDGSLKHFTCEMNILGVHISKSFVILFSNEEALYYQKETFVKAIETQKLPEVIFKVPLNDEPEIAFSIQDFVFYLTKSGELLQINHKQSISLLTDLSTVSLIRGEFFVGKKNEIYSVEKSFKKGLFELKLNKKFQIEEPEFEVKKISGTYDPKEFIVSGLIGDEQIEIYHLNTETGSLESFEDTPYVSTPFSPIRIFSTAPLLHPLINSLTFVEVTGSNDIMAYMKCTEKVPESQNEWTFADLDEQHRIELALKESGEDSCAFDICISMIDEVPYVWVLSNDGISGYELNIVKYENEEKLSVKGWDFAIKNSELDFKLETEQVKEITGKEKEPKQKEEKSTFSLSSFSNPPAATGFGFGSNQVPSFSQPALTTGFSFAAKPETKSAFSFGPTKANNSAIEKDQEPKEIEEKTETGLSSLSQSTAKTGFGFGSNQVPSFSQTALTTGSGAIKPETNSAFSFGPTKAIIGDKKEGEKGEKKEVKPAFSFAVKEVKKEEEQETKPGSFFGQTSKTKLPEVKKELIKETKPVIHTTKDSKEVGQDLATEQIVSKLPPFTKEFIDVFNEMATTTIQGFKDLKEKMNSLSLHQQEFDRQIRDFQTKNFPTQMEKQLKETFQDPEEIQKQVDQIQKDLYDTMSKLQEAESYYKAYTNKQKHVSGYLLSRVNKLSPEMEEQSKKVLSLFHLLSTQMEELEMVFDGLRLSSRPNSSLSKKGNDKKENPLHSIYQTMKNINYTALGKASQLEELSKKIDSIYIKHNITLPDDSDLILDQLEQSFSSKLDLKDLKSTKKKEKEQEVKKTVLSLNDSDFINSRSVLWKFLEPKRGKYPIGKLKTVKAALPIIKPIAQQKKEETIFSSEPQKEEKKEETKPAFSFAVKQEPKKEEITFTIKPEENLTAKDLNIALKEEKSKIGTSSFSQPIATTGFGFGSNQGTLFSQPSIVFKDEVKKEDKKEEKKEKKKEETKPAFSFSDSKEVKKEETKPAFSFSDSKEVKKEEPKPAFSFSDSKEVKKEETKPAFSFSDCKEVKKEETKPSFSISDSQEVKKEEPKPAFSFSGSQEVKKEETKPEFSFSDSKEVKKEEPKPAFSFSGSQEVKKEETKPAFSFSDSKEFKKEETKPSFSFSDSKEVKKEKPKPAFSLFQKPEDIKEEKQITDTLVKESEMEESPFIDSTSGGIGSLGLGGQSTGFSLSQPKQPISTFGSTKETDTTGQSGFFKPSSFTAFNQPQTPSAFGGSAPNKISPVASAFSTPAAASPAPAFGATAFSTPASAFGTPAASTSVPNAFGKPTAFSTPAAASPAPAFGATAFSTPASAFGTPAASTSVPNAFGKPTAFSTPAPASPAPAFGQSAFGQPAFGQSGFASTPTQPASQPVAFGQSAFGQSSFGQPAFGQSGFGQPAFGQSAFGQSQQTAFGKPENNTTPASASGFNAKPPR